MTLVVVEDLRKHFGAQEVLSGATLQLDEGKRKPATRSLANEKIQTKHS